MAVDLAARRPHRALVLVRTFDSLRAVAEEKVPLLPVSWLMTNRFDSVTTIKDCKRPIFIAHGDKDTLIPIHHAQRLARACDTELHVLRGLGHNDPLPADFYQSLREFLAQS